MKLNMACVDALLVGLIGWGGEAEAATPAKLHIFSIAVDDLRPVLGSYGVKQIIIRHTDRLPEFVAYFYTLAIKCLFATLNIKAMRFICKLNKRENIAMSEALAGCRQKAAAV